MKLYLNYARGSNNTISVADKQHIYLGSITVNHFGMVGFDQERALTHRATRDTDGLSKITTTCKVMK